MRRGARHSEEAKARLRAAGIKRWADPEARSRHSELLKRCMARSGVSERIAARTKAALADPKTRARQRAGQQHAMARPEVRKKISERTIEAMQDPAVRARMRAGMAQARALKAELSPLRALWASISADARHRFLSEIGDTLHEPK